MIKNRFTKLLLSFLFVLIIFNQVNLFTTNESYQDKEKVIIARVIDGDTVELKDGRVLRLANINSPEKISPLSIKSSQFLKTFVNKTVEIQIITVDKYGRSVSRIYSPLYLNKELVEQGLASKFLVQKEELDVFSSAENSAINNARGIWNHSIYYGCFVIDVNEKEEFVQIINSCSIPLSGFTIKDESRKIYKFPSTTHSSVKLYTQNGNNTQENLFWNSETHIWNDDRDSAYLFDKENNLAGYYSYGY